MVRKTKGTGGQEMNNKDCTYCFLGRREGNSIITCWHVPYCGEDARNIECPKITKK